MGRDAPASRKKEIVSCREKSDGDPFGYRGESGMSIGALDPSICAHILCRLQRLHTFTLDGEENMSIGIGMQLGEKPC